jgi:FAD synthetase
MSTAGVLIIGNEILSGKVVDTNSHFLASELRALGVDLRRILTIPDDVDLIAAEVRTMSELYDYVLTSGGIGPTHDDVTMEAVAQAFGRGVELSLSMCERIERFQGEPPNESQKKMATVPEGAQSIDAGGMWFPVVIVENVHILPGIPKLLEKKFLSIQDRFTGIPFQLRKIYVTRRESDIADHLNALLAEFPELMLGSYPRLDTRDYLVLLTLESRDGDYLRRAQDSLIERLPPNSIHKVE